MYTRDDKYRWVVLAISIMLMLTYAISLQFLPPIFNEIGKDIDFSDSQAGMLMGAYAMPGIVLPFLIACLMKRYKEKNLMLIALLVLIIGLVGFSFSKSFLLLFIFRLISGLGATVLVVIAPFLVTVFFQEEDIGVAMGFFNIAMPLGTVLSANLFAYLGRKISWHYIVLGIAALVSIVLVASYSILILPEEKAEKAISIKARRLSTGFWGNKNLWLIAAIWALANGQVLSYLTFGSQYFTGIGLDGQKGGFLTSLIMLVQIFLCPLVGIITDKTGWKKRLLFTGITLLGFSFIMIGRNPSTIPIWAIGLGVGFSPIPVMVFALLAEIVEVQHMGMGLGVLTMASNLGIAIGPPAFGLFLDITERNFEYGFMLLALLSFGLVIMTLKLRIEGKK